MGEIELERALKAFLEAARSDSAGFPGAFEDSRIIRDLVHAIKKLIEEGRGPTHVGPPH